MKFKSVFLAAIGLLAAQSCALAGSTIDPTQPPTGGAMVSAPVRNNFVAAYNDITNLLCDFCSGTAPASPTIGQKWRKTSVTPNLIYQWTGTAWVQVATFDITGGTVTPYVGNRLLTWQQLVPGLGTNGQCLVFTGTSTNPTAQNCLNSTNFTATAPISASASGSNESIGINLDSNFATVGGNLALASIAAGNLLCNNGTGSAEPSACSWNSFANQALGSSNGMFPVRYAGAWQTKLLGASVNDPGTGTIEGLLPIQTAAGASKTFATADLFQETRRSNGGSAMTDTFPASSAAGLVNGTRIDIANVDATASDTVTAGSGTTINGSSTYVILPGRDIWFVYDLPATQWRLDANTGSALLSANNLSDLGNFATARTNLGVAIGSNVEAWDSDLDCLAALATTGIIKRTGAGTCSAGAAAAADLTNGTTGTGAVVLANGPTFPGGINVTGNAESASFNNVIITDPGTATRITLQAGSTFQTMNSMVLASASSAALTFQGTDTYVGRATTDTLTNKTINGASNTLTVRLASDVTGSLPLANIATGTSDTVLGYWGSATASAVAVPNCSNALIYSTSTHAWTCNTTAGTGTVSEQKNTFGYGLTPSGNCDNTSTNASSPCNAAVSLTTASNVLASNVAMSTINTYVDGPSMAQGTSGVWHIDGAVTILDSTSSNANCKLWDGTTIIASGYARGTGAIPVTVSFSGNISSPAANVRISCENISTTTSAMVFNYTGNSHDSYVYGHRIQ